MNSDLVSIIVPVYNVEKYLKDCIESIINQTYENLEVILVNDGSIDSSLEICKLYQRQDTRITIIDKQNEGLSKARQVGINNIQGNYFCTVDSDDYIEKDYIKKMYTKLKQDGSDICVSSTRHILSDGSIAVWGFDDVNNAANELSVKDVYSNYYWLTRKYYMSDSWNKMYRTEFIRRSEVEFSLDKKYNGTDLLFNHKVLLHLPKISIVNDVLYNHRKLKNSRTGRKNKQLQKGFMIILDDLICEAEKLKYTTEKLKPQLSCLYVNFLRYTTFDIYKEFVSKKNIEQFEKLLENNKKYLNKNNSIELRTKYMEEIELKIFCCMLKYGKATGLSRYLKIRPFLVKSRDLLIKIKNINKLNK